MPRTTWTSHHSDAKNNQSINNVYVNFVSGWHRKPCCVTTHSWWLDATCAFTSAVILLYQVW